MPYSAAIMKQFTFVANFFMKQSEDNELLALDVLGEMCFGSSLAYCECLPRLLPFVYISELYIYNYTSVSKPAHNCCRDT